MKRKRQQLGVMRLTLVGALLCVLLGTVGSMSFAAFAPRADQGAMGLLENPMRVFDPFALRTVWFSEIGELVYPAGDETGVVSLRPSIRIPYRPEVRSAFRPGTDS